MAETNKEIVGFVRWISEGLSKSGKTKRIAIQEEGGVYLTYVSIPVSMLVNFKLGDRVMLREVSEGEFNGMKYRILSAKYGSIEVI